MRIFLAVFLLLSAPFASARSIVPPLPAEVSQVPLDPTRPGRALVGRLRYLGGVQIRSSDARVGGFSSLKWRRDSLYAVTDVGDWAMIHPIERQGRLVHARIAMMSDLRGPAGKVLEGSATGDAESLAPERDGWLVSFEHDHKILRYSRYFDQARPSELDPVSLFGALDENKGVEAVAAGGGRIFLCAERLPADSAPNCFIGLRGRLKPVSIPATASGLDPRTAFPVDADWGRDGTLYILMRSWSGGNDNRAAILSRTPRGELRVLATFVKPLTLENYEGLAVREERGRTFLYMISDDNFGEYNEAGKPETWQRTLLLKFELVG